MTSGISSTSWTSHECLTIGVVTPVMSHSWKASVPIRWLRTWPVTQTSGVESIHASAIGVTRLVAPGPGGCERDAGAGPTPARSPRPCALRPARGGRVRAGASSRARARRRSAGSRRREARRRRRRPRPRGSAGRRRRRSRSHGSGRNSTSRAGGGHQVEHDVHEVPGRRGRAAALEVGVSARRRPARATTARSSVSRGGPLAEPLAEHQRGGEQDPARVRDALAGDLGAEPCVGPKMPGPSGERRPEATIRSRSWLGGDELARRARSARAG